MSRLKKFCAETGFGFSENGCKAARSDWSKGNSLRNFACHLNSFWPPSQTFEGLSTLSSRQPSIIIADDSAVAREGLVAIIRRDLGYTVCGLAIDERSTRELAEKHQPDLLVIEPFLGHHDGIFLLKELAARFPEFGFSLYQDSAKRFTQNARCARAPRGIG